MTANAEEYEAKHVHRVYEEIASHFSSTRYKVSPWYSVAKGRARASADCKARLMRSAMADRRALPPGSAGRVGRRRRGVRERQVPVGQPEGLHRSLRPLREPRPDRGPARRQRRDRGRWPRAAASAATLRLCHFHRGGASLRDPRAAGRGHPEYPVRAALDRRSGERCAGTRPHLRVGARAEAEPPGLGRRRRPGRDSPLGSQSFGRRWERGEHGDFPALLSPLPPRRARG